MTYLPPPKGAFDVEWATQNNRIIQQELGRLQPLQVRVAELESGKQPLDGDLTAIAALTGTGYIRRTADDTWAISATIPNTSVTGLGTMSTQNAGAVNIDGGSIDGTAIGAAVRSSGAFTTIDANNTIRSTGNSGLPASGGSNAFYVGGFSSPDSGRIIFGDGSGWKFHLSRRSASTNTDLFTIQDNGAVSIAGTLRATQGDGVFSGYIGATKGIRIAHDASASYIEGVDSTLVSSYQPLEVRGSTLLLAAIGGTVSIANNTSITGTLSTTGAFTNQLATNKRLLTETPSSSAISDFSTGVYALTFSRSADGANGLSGVYAYEAAGSNYRLALASRGQVIIAAGGGTGYKEAPEVARFASGAVSITGTISASNLAGTTYTPTGTAVSNVTSVTTYVTAYQRVGNTVTIGGRCQIQATAAGLVRARLSVPVATNFANNYDAGGSGVSSIGPNCAIYADATNDDLLFEYTAAAGGFLIFYFNATYRII